VLLDTQMFASPAVMERWARQFFGLHKTITRRKKLNTIATDAGLTPAQQSLNDLWDEHVRDEFATKDAAAALDTMVPDAYVNHVPVLTGGVGRDQLMEFYSKHFIPNMPSDTEIVPISRTIGSDRLVDDRSFYPLD
jgi:hypothetical protein